MAMKMINLIFVGSVDHGKSTLIGRLLYDTKSLPKERIEEVKRVCESLGRKFEFAYILDALAEEREKNITIDAAQIFFSWKGKEYRIIDAPGHREFLKNTLTGATQAQAAVLIVSAKEGIEEQTKRHAFILKLLGIKNVIVVVNKMDAIGFEKNIFENVKKEIVSYLSSINLAPSSIIPISAFNGDNVVVKSSNIPWYKGKTLIEALESVENEEKFFDSFIFPVQDVYIKNNEKIYVGNVFSGKISQGDEVEIFPLRAKAKVKKILAPEEVPEISAPKAAGIVLETSTEIRRGSIITKGFEPKVASCIEANVFAIKDLESDEYDFFCSTQKRKAVVKIKEKVDIEELKIVETEKLNKGDIGKVIIKLKEPIVVENFYKVPELGKFTLEKNSEVVAGGIII